MRAEAINARRSREKAALIAAARVQVMHDSLRAVAEYRAAERARLRR